MNKLFIIIGLVFVAFFLFGCTESNNVLPFTTCQLINQTYLVDGVTKATCANLRNGDLNNMFLGVGGPDGNSPQWFNQIDISSEDINWSQLIDFPSGCGVNQAVKIVDSSLVCVDLPIDTNYETAGYDFGSIAPDFNLGEHSFYVGPDEQGYNSLANAWAFTTVYAGELIIDVLAPYGIDTSGNVYGHNAWFDSNVYVTDTVQATGFIGDGSQLTGTGDNLGNHVATQDINLNTQSIVDGNNGASVYFEDGVFVVEG